MGLNASVRLVADGLLQRQDDGWTLLGSRCESCGEHFFPVQTGCANCCGTDLVSCSLGDRGTLWSWTVQGFMPKTPYDSGETAETFQPYGVGYIEMPSGIKVEARLTVADPAQLRIGMPMALVLDPYRGGDEPIYTFAFAPVAAGTLESAGGSHE